MADRVRHIIGCMTGTSLDGLDAALVRITGEGLAMRAEFIAMVSRPLGDLADTLRSFASGHAHPPLDFLRAARKLGELHATACAELATGQPVDLVVAHGQTIWHAPRDPHGHLSWQLFDPWPIVRQLRAPVCYDLRQADLIAGGEGAPITPIADWVMYRSDREHRAIVNLGGIVNITRLPPNALPEDIGGGDICAGNIVIDGLVARLFPGNRFDEDGRLSSAGRFRGEIAEILGKEFHSFLGQGSLGRETFDAAMIDRLVSRLSPRFTPQDILVSAIDEIANHVADLAVIQRVGSFDEPERPEPCATVILAGGGVRNPTYVDRIRLACQGRHRVTTSDALGIPIEAREAMAFAVLGALSQDGVPITLPGVTGSTTPGRAGAWIHP